MTYQINGTDFLLQPTTGRWMPRAPVEITGDGHPVYSAVREFELRWQLSDAESVDQLRDWFETTLLTGTASVALPSRSTGTYSFQTYTGCVLYEPEQGVFFNEFTTDLVMIVGNIV